MTLLELRVLGDRVVVRPDPRPTMSDGGLIHLPETVTHGNEGTLDPNYISLTGVVVKLGDGLRWSTYACRHCGEEVAVTHPPSSTEKCAGCTYLLSESNTRLIEVDEDVQPFEVAVGDRVMFGRFAGRQVEIQEHWWFEQPLIDTGVEYMKGRTIKEHSGDFTVPWCRVGNEPFMDETQRLSKLRAMRVLIMRESEILGLVDDNTIIRQVYEEPTWNKPTKGLTV